jgi:hypothetical protein
MVLRPNGSRVVPVEIRVDGVPIKEVKVFKYLGFLVSHDLSFTAHVTRATERARAASTAITKILRRLNVRTFRRLGTYLTCYAESQFYCVELLPPNVIDKRPILSYFARYQEESKMND